MWNSSREWGSVYILASSCLRCKSSIETEQNVLEHKFYSARRAAGAPRAEGALNCAVFSPEARVRVSRGVRALVRQKLSQVLIKPYLYKSYEHITFVRKNITLKFKKLYVQFLRAIYN